MNTNTTGARYSCKSCAAESPTGIGYAVSDSYAFPAPAADCANSHVEA